MPQTHGPQHALNRNARLTQLNQLNQLKQMNSYQTEQLSTFEGIRAHLPGLKGSLQLTMGDQLRAYLAFREKTDQFLAEHFSKICTSTCYRNQRSACCSKDGIITFFADMAINILHSDSAAVNLLAERLTIPHQGVKCLYLSDQGCLWTIKPIVCQMFLCDQAQQTVFSIQPQTAEQWSMFEEEKKAFTWPNRPVLFDMIESSFIEAGCASPLMYLHNSPGLLRVKRQAGLI